MQKKEIQGDILLFFAAAIWGFAFVAQRRGMDFIRPFYFNGLRFALGSVSLIPIIYFNNLKQKKTKRFLNTEDKTLFYKFGTIAGLSLFAGSSFQQFGLIYTTAGNGGFITGLYVVIVPIMGIFIGHRTERTTWIGALLAVIGLYLLSVKSNFSIGFGDMLVFISAFFWALHVHIISYLSSKFEPVKVAAFQFAICSLVSLIMAMIFEDFNMHSIKLAALPIAYAGFFSVGIAYTLQVIGQRKAHPSNAAIILSLESVFAVIGGWLLLNEYLNIREFLGCVFMLCGMLLTQIKFKKS